MMQEDIDAIFAKNGPFENRRDVPQDVIEKYVGVLPDVLLEIWRQQGIGDWAKGLYRLCLPSDFDGLLSQVFHADKDFSHQDCHVIAYTAFGKLLVWSERHWLIRINLLNSELTATGLIAPEKNKNKNTPIITEFFLIHDSENLNVYDDDGKPLFARARKKLGPLEPGECYGFFPALAMGGAPELKNLKRVKALEHFIFLAQLQQFSLVDYLARPIKVVRKIG